MAIGSDITLEDDEESSGYVTEEVDELLITKREGIENDITRDLDTKMDNDEESSGFIKEEVKQQKASKIPDKNIDNSMYSIESENQEKPLYTGQHFDATEENHKRKSNLFNSHKSPYSLRYIKEGEIGKVENETEATTKKRMKPVLRGQHIPETTLVEFSFNHIRSDEDSLGDKDIEGSSLYNFQEEVKDNSLTFGKENIDKILKAETKFENELAGDDISNSKEVIGMERQYFTKNIEKDASYDGWHPLLISHHESNSLNLDKNYEDKELLTSREKVDQDFADEDLDFHESIMKEMIEDKVKEIVDKKVKEHFSIEDVDGNESEDVNLDKNYKDKELITSIEKSDQDFADEDLDFHESLMKELLRIRLKR